MSNSIFPTLPGIGIKVKKTPSWKTKAAETVSGKEVRAAFMLYPTWFYSVEFEFLRSNTALAELQTLVGFFNQMKGAYDDFLFLDPDDYAVTAYQFGTGDGATSGFQLKKAYGGFVEPVQNVKGTPLIYKAGVLQATPANYSINSTGVVTFTSAPTAGQALTWTGEYYLRVRFKQDLVDFEQFMKFLWQAKKVEFRSIK